MCGEERRDIIINYLSDIYSIKEIYEFLNNGLTEHTQVLLELFADEVSSNGYKKLKIQIYDKFIIRDFEEKSFKETYKFLRRFCLKMTPDQMEGLMWLI